jgi:hypothetical protein
MKSIVQTHAQLTTFHTELKPNPKSDKNRGGSFSETSLYWKLEHDNLLNFIYLLFYLFIRFFQGWSVLAEMIRLKSR